MSPTRKTAVGVGVLFIIATAAPLASLPFLGSLSAPDPMPQVAARANLVSLGCLLELIMACAIPAIAILIYPILKRHSETLALGYAAVRIVEGVLFLVFAVVGLQLLLALSRGHAPADAPYLRTVAALLVTAHDEAYLVGGRLVFSASALILNFALYRARLVPRWLSLWGLIGAALILAGGLTSLLAATGASPAFETVSFLPIAVQEMVFAVWLLARGFSTPETIPRARAGRPGSVAGAGGKAG